MSIRATETLVGCCVALLVSGLLLTGPVDAQSPSEDEWEMPRTVYGHPDLQGNWSNATMTPMQRPEGQGPTLTIDEVAELEGGRLERIQEAAAPSDPDRSAPPVGGDGSTGAAGGVGGYNNFWIDAGNRVAIFNGEYRSSLITRPPDGRRPELTPEARERQREQFAFRRQFGQYDNPENRPMAERCIVSFGSNAGPPMTPNYFYNNNYTIVQTPDHVMILTEMVHDVRIIRLGEPDRLPDHVRPWFGDSWGRWQGDTLVVETTNISPDQGYFPRSPDHKVIERFTRADENTINYEFTVIDPATYTEVWGGEIPFYRQPGQVYEYACHEGNYALANVLSGARAEEREESREDQQNQPDSRYPE